MSAGRWSSRLGRLAPLLRALRARLAGERGDYRAYLFGELRTRLGQQRPRRILEIGPKDGLDTRRLLGLGPERLTVVDLPRMEAHNAVWLKELPAGVVEYLSANLMYSEAARRLPPFDLVWCTGVLYHNPEQLRMIRRLFELLLPGGILVLETATVRNRRLAHENVVEILHPPSQERRRRDHLSANVTHLPSARAVRSWLEMVGFAEITESACHREVSRARARVAFLATKPQAPRDGTYYDFDGGEGFVIGNSL